MKNKLKLGVVALSLTLSAPVAATAEELNLICSAGQEWCDLMVGAFEEQTGIDVAMVRKSTGEALAQIRAEAANPKTDAWWGGTGDPHLIAASEGLLQVSGADISDLQDWAVNMSTISEGKTVGIYSGALGIAYNPEILAEKDITPPSCWRDLADPIYKGEIQVANPNSSGTAYTELATFVQLFGEDDAFKLLAEIGLNVNQYTKSGSAPSKAAARGETGISIGFMHDMVKLKTRGFPLEIVAPCEGTGYEVGAVSIIEGARNLDSAKAWVEFALQPETQELAVQVESFQVPSNVNTNIPPESPDLDTIDLIDYDFGTYGSTDTRARLLARWDADVKNAGN